MIAHIENRTQRRLETELSAGVIIISRMLDYLVLKPQFQCITQDVSIGGMKLLADRPLREGTTVRLHVVLSENEKDKALKLRGRVCWANQGSEGKFFAGIRLDHRPQRAVAVWAETIRQRVRAHFRNLILAGASSETQNDQGLRT
jgi:PilZ domain